MPSGRARTVTEPPERLYLIAFEIRLSSTCLRRRASAKAQSGVSPASTLTRSAACAASGRHSDDRPVDRGADVDRLDLHAVGVEAREVDQILDQRRAGGVRRP